MKTQETDIVIVGAGPVGLMSAYLAKMCGMRAIVVDKSACPLKVGRADALNARTLQLLEIADLFKHLYPLGKTCNTSSVWANGSFVSRQSTWWDALEGCFHKHFLMLGQAFTEQLLDSKLTEVGAPVKRNAAVSNVELIEGGCLTTLAGGETIRSKYVIGADGSQSLVRSLFQVPFEITRPQIVWAVVDGVIETDFPKVPEIIVFQNETSDVAWIPREGNIDRFYIRMDRKDFTLEEAIARINLAMKPHTMHYKEITWFSHFSVKESVAERFNIGDRVFLAGDASHIHSVNGGMGLNTGLADAFNLIWKMHMVQHASAPTTLLRTYETERKTVARNVIETSGELVRSTKFSKDGTHANDYVDIVQRRSGYITGMGVRYGEAGIEGTRLFDFKVCEGGEEMRIYSLLDYTRFTLLIFGEKRFENLPRFIKVIHVPSQEGIPYSNRVILVRPDSYIAASLPIESASTNLILEQCQRAME